MKVVFFSPVLGYIIGLPEPKQTFLKVGPRPRPSHRGRGGHHPRPRPSIGPENWPSLDPATAINFLEELTGKGKAELPFPEYK